MKYTKARVSNVINIMDRFREKVSFLVDKAGYRGSLETIDYIHGDDLMVSTRWWDRCGGYETEQVRIPLAWLAVEDYEADALIAAKHEEKKRAEADRQAEEARKAQEQKRLRDLAELERLKKQYETTNGETP